MNFNKPTDMKITFYLYNAFLIEWDDKKIAIDPGALFAYWFSFAPLIPKEEWRDVTHIFVTHGDPDHYWHTDRMMTASGAPIIVNESMIQQRNGKAFMLGPRSKGLTFDTAVSKFHTLTVDETSDVDGMKISGIKTAHGPLTIKVGPVKKTERPGIDERIGWGSMGFKISYQGKSVVNLGDTLLRAEDWKNLDGPDVLMLPIGGRKVGNTMEEEDALEAIRMIRPKVAIPVHYNCPMLFSKNGNPADETYFQRESEKLGIDCVILKKGCSFQIN
jgi:L-ascorbate metabolism protein UlaG (beta-lactamase superfamily)